MFNDLMSEIRQYTKNINKVEVIRSDKVGKIFKKQHKDILAKIFDVKKELLELNTKLTDYFIETTRIVRGKEERAIFLTRKGFDLIVLSLTGKKALKYKLWYIDMFHNLQIHIDDDKLQELINKNNEKWKIYREEAKETRKRLTDIIKDTIVKYRYEVENKSDGKYYYHFTKLIYDKLGIKIPRGADVRDVVSDKELLQIEFYEKWLISRILHYHNSGVHYKDYYKIIKKELETL